jgi:gamma-glutamylcyclotransferase (GGCT)/AIG2-like uncharacterized protein YtfP
MSLFLTDQARFPEDEIFPPEREADEEWVFVYGPLRRDASQAFHMADARFLQIAEISGKLLEIGGRAAVVPGGPENWVTGDLFVVSSDKVGQIAEFEGLGYERVEMNVYPVGSRRSLGTAWVLRWSGGFENSRVIKSGDWLDVERPRTLPWLTIVSLLCLGSPVAVFWSVGGLAYSPDPLMRRIWLGIAMVISAAPVAAFFAVHFSDRRREKWEGFRVLLFVVSGAASALILGVWVVGIIDFFLRWLSASG